MTKRKSTQPTLPGSAVTMGLDIGYGVVKAITTDQVVMFPSVMGHAREMKFQQEEIAKRHPGDQITDNEGDWFVGDLALAQLPPGELLRLRGRTANESTMGNAFRLRLAKAAIGKVMQGMWNRDIVHLRIATGLPTDHMRDAAELKAALIGQHLITTDIGQSRLNNFWFTKAHRGHLCRGAACCALGMARHAPTKTVVNPSIDRIII